MGKRFGFEDYDQDSRTNLLQPGENDVENIWINFNIIIIY